MIEAGFAKQNKKFEACPEKQHTERDLRNKTKKNHLASPCDILVRIFSQRGHDFRDERVPQQAHGRGHLAQRLHTHAASVTCMSSRVGWIPGGGGGQARVSGDERGDVQNQKKQVSSSLEEL